MTQFLQIEWKNAHSNNLFARLTCEINTISPASFFALSSSLSWANNIKKRERCEAKKRKKESHLIYTARGESESLSFSLSLLSPGFKTNAFFCLSNWWSRAAAAAVNHFAICPGIKTVECAWERLSNFAATPRQYICCQSSPSSRNFSVASIQPPDPQHLRCSPLHLYNSVAAASAAVMMQGAQSGAQESRTRVVVMPACECARAGILLHPASRCACSTTVGARLPQNWLPALLKNSAFENVSADSCAFDYSTIKSRLNVYRFSYLCRRISIFLRIIKSIKDIW